MYIAHTRQDGEIQTLKEHLINVQTLCEEMGEKMNLKYTVGLAGLLHDLGKFSNQFQDYLHEIHLTGTSIHQNGGDHATAGGLLLNEYCTSPARKLALVPISNAIISHHGKLNDIESPEKEESNYHKRMTKDIEEFDLIKQRFFEEVLTKKELERYMEKVTSEINAYVNANLAYFKKMNFKVASKIEIYNHISVFLTKFIFSCLIDADRLDTKFFDEKKKLETINVSWATLQQRLDEKLHTFQVKNTIDELRVQMSQQCFDGAAKETAIYSLSIPTGGGKTLASLRFALQHAQKQSKKRIIYVVPYTTIIEQNVQVVKNILWREGEPEFILEHHSNVINDEKIAMENIKERNEFKQQAKNYVDNWDSPIIFTTLVQYLNVFYDAKNRNTRRLHNLLDSIIIFDEVQSLPLQTLALFNESIRYLSEIGRTTILLCTATQPALESISKYSQKPIELVENLDTVIEKFSRTKIEYLEKAGGYNTIELKELVLEKVRVEKNVLVIVNTKAVARKLAQQLSQLQADEAIDVFHLSTSMCPSHRRSILTTVKKRLDDKERYTVCISTQLIEAGVDISFNCVIRSLAGLSSIAQAAGRCNRHGLELIKKVYVIKHNEENLSRLKEISVGGRIAEGILRDCKQTKSNPLGQKMISLYFEKLFKEYKAEVEFPYQNTTLYKLFFKGFAEISEYLYSNSIGTASEKFQVISSESETLIVPYENPEEKGESGKDIINLLLENGQIDDFSSLMKRAQQYSINIFPYERRILEEMGAITVVTFGKRNMLILNDHSYSEAYGLDIKNSHSYGVFL